MAYVLDPLGSGFNDSKNYLAALGGDQVNYGDGSTLDAFLDEVWTSSNVELVKAPRGAVRDFGSAADAYGGRYNRLCENNCDRNGGIPSIWLAQPAFQKYRT